jgi:hypothetical protein
MRKYFNGKKYITNLQGAISYETDMVEISLLKKDPPDKSGNCKFTSYFEYENEKYSLTLDVAWADDDIGKPYLDTVEFIDCVKE